MLKHEDKRLAL